MWKGKSRLSPLGGRPMGWGRDRRRSDVDADADDDGEEERPAAPPDAAKAAAGHWRKMPEPSLWSESLELSEWVELNDDDVGRCCSGAGPATIDARGDSPRDVRPPRSSSGTN
jgi:hypothetical protein